jgi:hypothetical protein
MRTLTSFISASALTLVLAAPALAKGGPKGGTPQNHHCMKDGAEMAGKTHKQCTKEGGTWEKLAGDAPKAPAPAPKADAPAPAPKADAPAKAAEKPAPTAPAK